jgi:hypothetical protein
LFNEINFKGSMLDSSKKNYDVVFSLASKFYLVAIIIYFSIKIMLIKYLNEDDEENGELGEIRHGYVEFNNNDTPSLKTDSIQSFNSTNEQTAINVK